LPYGKGSFLGVSFSLPLPKIKKGELWSGSGLRGAPKLLSNNAFTQFRMEL
jgi:hypothetical protein